MATTQTSCDCWRAIRAPGEDAIPLWLSSIIPPSRRRKAHSSRRGHVLWGECWQLLSSVIIAHSQTSWNKDATKDPAGNGTGNAVCTHMKEPQSITLRYTRYHTSTQTHTPCWCALSKWWVKKGQIHKKYIWILTDFLKKTGVVHTRLFVVTRELLTN